MGDTRSEKGRWCKRGHEKTPDTTYPSTGSCKICAKETGRRYRDKNREAIRAQQAEYRNANREELAARQAAWRVENSDVVRERDRIYYQFNQDAIRARRTSYREANRAAINARKAEYAKILRQGALDHYGHRCACCGLDVDDVFLSIDHIFGGGADHRRKLRSSGGTNTYRWLRDAGYPADFQTLCRSCNWGKRLRNDCPHREPITPRTSKQRYLRKLKTQVVQAYGGSCACCGEEGIDFLHIDHVNGGGKEHRRSFAGNPGSFYLRLRQAGFPSDPPLRVLCDNCNYAVQFGQCPHQEVNR
jgi:hypothetical protein